MKIIVISQTAWRLDNSFGNSFSGIFENIENIEIANIYCNYGVPSNNIVKKHFQITEKTLIKNILNKKSPSGKEIIQFEKSVELDNSEMKIFNGARKNRLQIFFWARDIIWKLGRWKSTQLIKFIDEFNPDIIFQPLYYSTYINDIVLFVKKHTKVPMVCYVSDDVYTLRQFSLSPLFWIDRFVKRRKIKQVVNKCEHLYVISEVQKQDYEKCFKKECKILTKGAYFTKPEFKSTFTSPLKIVYTGNIGGGRWRSLALIGKILSEINKNDIKAQLYIYSMTPLTRVMEKTLIIENSVFFMGGISSVQVTTVQSDADVLLHVEPTDLKGRLQVRHSFSTKIVDYFNAGRCIFAVGWHKAASIDYLVKNKVALVAFEENSIREQLHKILGHPQILKEIAQKAWDCGKRNHQIQDIQLKLSEELKMLTH